MQGRAAGKPWRTLTLNTLLWESAVLHTLAELLCTMTSKLPTTCRNSSARLFANCDKKVRKQEQISQTEEKKQTRNSSLPCVRICSEGCDSAGIYRCHRHGSGATKRICLNWGSWNHSGFRCASLMLPTKCVHIVRAAKRPSGSRPHAAPHLFIPSCAPAKQLDRY